MRVIVRRLLPALLVVVAVCGCDAGASRPGQQAAAATATPTATALPPDAPIPDAFRGMWGTQLDSGGESHGAWTLRISSDEMELRNPVAAESDWFPLHARAATQEGVSFDADQECLGASYRWTLRGDELTFEVVDRDPCADRWDTLTTATWRRLPSPTPSP
jgi:hypothetical protein